MLDENVNDETLLSHGRFLHACCLPYNKLLHCGDIDYEVPFVIREFARKAAW